MHLLSCKLRSFVLAGKSCNGWELSLNGTVLYNTTLDLPQLPENNTACRHSLLSLGRLCVSHQINAFVLKCYRWWQWLTDRRAIWISKAENYKRSINICEETFFCTETVKVQRNLATVHRVASFCVSQLPPVAHTLHQIRLHNIIFIMLQRRLVLFLVIFVSKNNWIFNWKRRSASVWTDFNTHFPPSPWTTWSLL